MLRVAIIALIGVGTAAALFWMRTSTVLVVSALEQKAPVPPATKTRSVPYSSNSKSSMANHNYASTSAPLACAVGIGPVPTIIPDPDPEGEYSERPYTFVFRHFDAADIDRGVHQKAIKALGQAAFVAFKKELGSSQRALQKLVYLVDEVEPRLRRRLIEAALDGVGEGSDIWYG